MLRPVAVLAMLALDWTTLGAQLVERRAPMVADISLPATWTIDDSPVISALLDSMQAWGDDFNDQRYRYAASVLQVNPVLRARGADGASEGATLWLNYIPGLRISDIDSIPAEAFAEMASYRCEATRRQLEQSGGTIECDAPAERRIGDWRGLVAMQRVRVPSANLDLRRADVVIPMHGAMFTAVIAVNAGEGDVARLQEIVATIRPIFTRSGAGGPQ